MAASSNNSSRVLLEKGLARYGRGQIEDALKAWREALDIDPNNEEARKLVSFVEERLTSQNRLGGDHERATSEMPAVKDDDAAGPRDTETEQRDGRKDTSPELERTTEETLPTEGGVDEGDEGLPRPRKRRSTLVSGIPAILAQSTKPASASDGRATPVPPRPGVPSRLDAIVFGKKSARHDAATPVPPPLGPAAADNDGTEEFGKVPTRNSFAPVGTNTKFPPKPPDTPEPDTGDNTTRPLGSERSRGRVETSRPASNSRATQTFRIDTPLDLALTTARQRSALLVDECRKQMEAGNVAKAAAAAEEALEEADKAPMPGIAEVIEPARAMFAQAFEMHVGPEVGVPTMAMDMSAAGAASFDHRTGFLLSCIDGTLPVQTLLDIAGMGRFDSMRVLSGLLRRRIIKF